MARSGPLLLSQALVILGCVVLGAIVFAAMLATATLVLQSFLSLALALRELGWQFLAVGAPMMIGKVVSMGVRCVLSTFMIALFQDLTSLIGCPAARVAGTISGSLL